MRYEKLLRQSVTLICGRLLPRHVLMNSYAISQATPAPPFQCCEKLDKELTTVHESQKSPEIVTPPQPYNIERGERNYYRARVIAPGILSLILVFSILSGDKFDFAKKVPLPVSGSSFNSARKRINQQKSTESLMCNSQNISLVGLVLNSQYYFPVA